MAWVSFAVSLVFAVLVVNAFLPIRRDPLAALSFAFGWIPSELPVQTGVLLAGITVALDVSGALGGAPGWAGLVLAVGSCGGFVVLTVRAHEAGALVDAALREATGGPVGAAGYEEGWVWNTWWRLVIAIPFRWRGIRRVRNVDYWGDGNYRHKLDILSRRALPPEGAPVLVYIHGGAWIMGDKRQQGIPLMHELARRGWVCVAINYRLSPRATWPMHIVDCKRAVGWVREHIAEYGGDPGFIAVSGGSAGGHLSSLLALTPDQPLWQPGFEGVDTSVDACLPFYGVYDMTGDKALSGAYGPGLATLLERRVMKTTMVDNPAVFEEASPDHRVTTEAPPMFVFHGTNDTLVPVAVARHFVGELRRVSAAPVAYVELPGAQHAFDVLASIRCRHTIRGAVHFLEAIRAGSGVPSPASPPATTGADGRPALPVTAPGPG
jgi:acetyl esterase/lipase